MIVHHGRARGDQHFPAVRRIFDGIDNQLIQRLLDQSRVTLDDRCALSMQDSEMDVAFSDGFLKTADQVINDPFQRHRHRVYLPIFATDAREVQHHIDHFVNTVRSTEDAVSYLS